MAAATVVATVLPLALFVAGPASADYAPNGKDVVGVGSDTLQYMLDFLADGDAYGDPGYNNALNKYKLVSFDATADANARLAYGVDGGQASQTTCTPGTGSTVGTGNQSGSNSGVPCVLNPTVVLRAGTQPVQRPNGSGAGFNALVQDIVAKDNASTTANGSNPEVINFARASATQTTSATLPGTEGIDQLSVASDPLPILKASSGSNAVPLSASQLKEIYGASTPNCYKWNDPTIGGTSSDTIIPIIPQVGSGTRKYFLQEINGTPGGAQAPLGNCAVVGEENDPTAIAAQGVNAPDAIEPISLGRLYLYLGESLVGGTTPTNELPGNAGYFLDPSCAYLSGVSGCGTGSVSGDTWVTPSVTPAVTPILTGTPAGTDGGGTLGNGDTPTGLFLPIRTLYLYFRSTDLNSTTTWQPGSTQNWVNALFYNPGGATPYIQTGAGQTLLEDAGVVPAGVNGTPAEACLNITTNVAC